MPKRSSRLSLIDRPVLPLEPGAGRSYADLMINVADSKLYDLERRAREVETFLLRSLFELAFFCRDKDHDQKQHEEERAYCILQSIPEENQGRKREAGPEAQIMEERCSLACSL